jgi:membrane-associated phospholipid phosphatase
LIKEITSTNENVRKFGRLFAGLFFLLSAYGFWTSKAYWPWTSGAAAFFGLCSLGSPGIALLRPLYIGWMMFAFVLGWINTRIILGIFFYLILTPIGLVLRLTGKDLLDERMDREASTYWKKRDPLSSDPQRCERMF